MKPKPLTPLQKGISKRHIDHQSFSRNNLLPSKSHFTSTNQSSFRRSSKFKSHLYFRMESMIENVKKYNEFKGRRVPYFQSSFEDKVIQIQSQQKQRRPVKKMTTKDLMYDPGQVKDHQKKFNKSYGSFLSLKSQSQSHEERPETVQVRLLKPSSRTRSNKAPLVSENEPPGSLFCKGGLYEKMKMQSIKSNKRQQDTKSTEHECSMRIDENIGIFENDSLLESEIIENNQDLEEITSKFKIKQSK